MNQLYVLTHVGVWVSYTGCTHVKILSARDKSMGALESCSSGGCTFPCPDSASVNAFIVPSSLFGKELINIPEAGTLCFIVSL